MNTNLKLLKDIIIQSTNEPLPRITAKKKCSFVAQMKNLFICVFAILLVSLHCVVPAYGASFSTSSAITPRLFATSLRSSVTYFYHVPQVGSYTEENVLNSGLALTDSSTEYLVASLYDDVYLAFLYRENLYPSVYFLSFSSHSNGVYIYDDEYNYSVWDLSLINGQTDIYSFATSITSSVSSSFNMFIGSVSDLYSAFSSFISSSASPFWVDSSTFDISSNDSVSFSFEPTIPYVIGYHPANTEGYNSFVVLAPSDVLTSDVVLTVDGEHSTISTIGYTSINDVVYNYRWIWIPTSVTPNSLIPRYTDLNSDVQALATFAYNNPYSETVYSNYSLPNGNVLYIDIGSGNDYFFNFLTYMPDTSAILGSPWAVSQYYLWSDSLPSSTTFSASDGTYITWRKSPTDRNLLGQTKTAISELSGTAPSRYLVIVNPLIYAQSTNKFNGILKVNNIPNGTTIYSYPLNAYLSDGTYVNDVSSNGGTGTASTSGGLINTVSTDDSSVDYSAPSGGLNWQESSQSIAEDVRSLKESLSQFFENVLTLLGKPVGYIQQLIFAGSDMMQHVSGLWSWLPDDVSSMLTSSLIVMVGVAVFKVFL